MRLEWAIAHAPSGSREQVGVLDQDLLGRVQLAKSLAALDPAGESRVRESLRARLQEAINERRVHGAGPPVVRRSWLMRRPLLAAELALLLVVALLAVAAPASLAALVERVARMIEMVRIGEHTEIVRQAPHSEADVAAIVEEYKRQLARGESWSLSTPYGGFGGNVPHGQPASVRRVSRLADLPASTRKLLIPSGVHRGELLRFDHAFLAPGRAAFIFFGSGENEIFLAALPVDEHRAVTYGRSVSRKTAGGKRIVVSPELTTEKLSLGGQTAVWDPDPTAFSRGDSRHCSEGSALRWEKDGVSYSLMGRSLRREEAVKLFLSLRSIEEGG
jgi:hypothetical protein